MVELFGLWGLVAPLATIFLLGIFALFAFEVWMIVNAIQNKHITDTARILWVIGMLTIHPVIAIVYFFTDYQKSNLG